MLNFASKCSELMCRKNFFSLYFILFLHIEGMNSFILRKYNKGRKELGPPPKKSKRMRHNSNNLYLYIMTHPLNEYSSEIFQFHLQALTGKEYPAFDCT